MTIKGKGHNRPCYERKFQASSLLLLLVVPTTVSSIAHDVILPNHTPNGCACANWSNNSTMTSMFEGDVPANSICALPAKGHYPSTGEPIYTIYDGYCLCDTDPAVNPDLNGAWFTWCSPPKTFPSQISLGAVSPSKVVVNFVTGDDGVTADSDVEGKRGDKMRSDEEGGGGEKSAAPPSCRSSAAPPSCQ